MKFPVPARWFRSPLLLGMLAAFSGCDARDSPKGNGTSHQAVTSASLQSSGAPIHFSDITAHAKIDFQHNNGAFGVKLLPEQLGSGVTFIDYNRDGYQDIFLVNGRDWTEPEVREYQKSYWASAEATVYMKSRGLKEMRDPEHLKPVPTIRPQRNSTCKLYRNNKDGTFTDTTSGSGLELTMYGLGVATGDYDNDGWPDMYVTSIGGNYLFRNRGNGTFQEVAAQAGVRNAGLSTVTAWVDYDKDGYIDLFVGHYAVWTPRIDAYDSTKEGKKLYSGPGHYKNEVSHLYRNLGKGKFEDVSVKSGIQLQLKDGKKIKVAGKALGVAICDYNNDDWPDIFVANDRVQNFLFRNNKNKTFTEVAISTGTAFSEKGEPRSGMGVDIAEIDDSGRESIVVGNFSDQMIGLYQDQGGGNFTDTAPRSEIGRVSMGYLTFGLAFMDADNDGRLDIFAANGHIEDIVNEVVPNVECLQRPFLFYNEGHGHFKEIGISSGEVLKKPIIARGLACSDIELDGDLDLLLTTNGLTTHGAGTAILLRNDNGNKNNSIRLVLQGSISNRSAIGAKVEAKVGNRTIRRMVRSGSSYLSQSELPVTLGFGQATRVDVVTITWPSGKITRLYKLAANHIFMVDEDKGLLRQQPLQHSKQ